MTDAVPGSKSIWRKRLVRTLQALCGVYLLACAGCAACQRSLIYFPPVCSPEAADAFGRQQRLERWFDSAGKPIGWKRLCVGQTSQGSILVTHGNACAAVQCARFANVLQKIGAFDVFIVEYPGYADVPGKPTERSLYEAADAAFHALPVNRPVFLVGESLGTGVASYVAGKFATRVAGVALLAPFNSLVDVGQAHVVILPVSLLLVDRFPSEDHLRTFHGPLAVIVGGEDRVVPEKFGRRLYDGYQGPKRLWEFPLNGHETVTQQSPEVWTQIVEFWLSSHSSTFRQTFR
jgi:pimeloyl-ACP methyl ester carboxylesterase